MTKRIASVALIFAALFMSMCDRKPGTTIPEGETILTGEASVLVDETLLPIMEDQVAVFESTYRAKIKLVPRSETEAIRAFLKDSSKIIVLARNLNAEEKKFFTSKNRFPKAVPFAKDAIALIGNKKESDTVIALQDVIDVMKGKQVAGISGLVFDNPNSGTVQYMLRLAGLSAIPEKNVYSFKTNAQVIKFVSENPRMVGVVGLNWIYQPTPEIESFLKNINVLSVKSLTGTNFVSPTQNNLAEGNYPLARDLFVVNAQGYEGLGIGFSSFVSGERGQRIILKSGLLPVRIPSRKIVIKR